jgi:uncharacterized protein YjbJ (UPF0337 family)
MENDPETKDLESAEDEKGRKLSGFSQFIVGELETIGGVLTGDPLTQAEGEFNVEVGTVREEIEDDLEESDEAAKRRDAGDA